MGALALRAKDRHLFWQAYLFHGLQLREDSQVDQDDAGNGGGRNGFSVGHGRYRDDDGHDWAIKNPPQRVSFMKKSLFLHTSLRPLCQRII